MNLMKIQTFLITNYMKSYIAAPAKWGERVFGRKVPTKMDVRRAFLQDLKMIAEVAQLQGDKAVLNKINCCMEENFDAELKALKSTLGQ